MITVILRGPRPVLWWCKNFQSGLHSFLAFGVWPSMALSFFCKRITIEISCSDPGDPFIASVSQMGNWNPCTVFCGPACLQTPRTFLQLGSVTSLGLYLENRGQGPPPKSLYMSSIIIPSFWEIWGGGGKGIYTSSFSQHYIWTLSSLCSPPVTLFRKFLLLFLLTNQPATFCSIDITYFIDKLWIYNLIRREI